jgi:hypothetical protein
VEQAATLLLDNYPERVQPLIRRWLESAIRYGEV